LKKRFSLIEVGLIVSIILLATGVFSVYTKTGPLSKLTVLAAGIPDAYGSRIASFTVLQNTTGSWNTITSVDYTTFTNGTTLSIPANQKTIIEVLVYLNSTLASDIGTAITRTRVYLTISGVVTSSLMVYSHSLSSPVSGMWWIDYDYPASYVGGSPSSVWTPATDTTYTITVLYQAYY
jgi:hypothetical protein